MIGGFPSRSFWMAVISSFGLTSRSVSSTRPSFFNASSVDLKLFSSSAGIVKSPFENYIPRFKNFPQYLPGGCTKGHQLFGQLSANATLYRDEPHMLQLSQRLAERRLCHSQDSRLNLEILQGVRGEETF